MTPAALSEAARTDAAPRIPRLKIAHPAISIADALQKWREHMTIGGTGPEQQDMVCRTVSECATFCQWHTIGDITADAARKWLVAIRPQYKPRTLKHHRDRLRAFGAFLRRQGLATPNPMRGLPQVKVIHEAARLVPTDQQVSRLIQFVASTPVRGDRWLVYLLAATTGIRIGAIRQLQRSMFKHDKAAGLAWLDLPAKIQKNGHAARVYLPRETALFLDAHPQQTPARWFKKVPKWDDFNRDIEGAGLAKSEQIGGPTLSRHSLRHFASNRMKWAETMSDAERSQQNQHLSAGMTTRVYTDPTHPDYGRKIYRMQGLLPDGFTPTPTKRGRKLEKRPVDSEGEISDTTPAEFVSPQKPTLVNAAACGPPSELSTLLIAGAALSSVSVGGRASITNPEQQVQGSTPYTRVSEKTHLTVQGDLQTVALVIEALASRQGGWGLVTVSITIQSTPPHNRAEGP
jgi:integrase